MLVTRDNLLNAIEGRLEASPDETPMEEDSFLDNLRLINRTKDGNLTLQNRADQVFAIIVIEVD